MPSGGEQDEPRRGQVLGEAARVDGRDHVVVLGVDHHDLQVREPAAHRGRQREAGGVPVGVLRVPERGGHGHDPLQQRGDAVAEEAQDLRPAE